MSPDRRERRPYLGEPPIEVQTDVAFKPYKGVRKVCGRDEGRHPYIVPESYEYWLILRRRLSFLGIQGCVDVINEHPQGWVWPLLNRGVEKPLGEVHYKTLCRGPNDQQTLQEPVFYDLVLWSKIQESISNY